LEDEIIHTIVESARQTLEYYPFRDFTKLVVKNISLKKDSPLPVPRVFYNYELIKTTEEYPPNLPANTEE
jgi:hypothetical protein